jgi:hypothetical protein
MSIHGLSGTEMLRLENCAASTRLGLVDCWPLHKLCALGYVSEARNHEGRLGYKVTELGLIALREQRTEARRNLSDMTVRRF